MFTTYITGFAATFFIVILKDYLTERKPNDWLARSIAYIIVSLLWPAFWITLFSVNLKEVLED